MNITRLRIPTGRRQTSWLFTSAAEKLNSGLPRTTSASGQNRIWTRDLQVSNLHSNHSAMLSPLPTLIFPRMEWKVFWLIVNASLFLHSNSRLLLSASCCQNSPAYKEVNKSRTLAEGHLVKDNEQFLGCTHLIIQYLTHTKLCTCELKV